MQTHGKGFKMQKSGEARMKTKALFVLSTTAINVFSLQIK